VAAKPHYCERCERSFATPRQLADHGCGGTPERPARGVSARLKYQQVTERMRALVLSGQTMAEAEQSEAARGTDARLVMIASEVLALDGLRREDA
jgi:hypothetical protein